MLGLSLHGWEEVTVWALAITALAALALVVGTRIVIILQREEVESARLKVAEATAGAAKANEQAANANVVAAHANERAAEANRLAEAEKSARLKIEANISPRRISSHQRQLIVAALKDLEPKPRVALQTFSQSDESKDFLKDLEAVFNEAGTIATQSSSFRFTQIEGLRIQFNKSIPHSLAVYTALKKADVPMIVDDDKWSFPIPNVRKEELPDSLYEAHARARETAPDVQILVGLKPTNLPVK